MVAGRRCGWLLEDGVAGWLLEAGAAGGG